MREATLGLERPRWHDQAVAFSHELGEAAEERIPAGINAGRLDVDQALADFTGFVTEQFQEFHHETPLTMEVARLVA